jgi:hypothetical protein
LTGQRGGAPRGALGIEPGGRRSSPKLIAIGTPSDDTLNGKSAPHMPGPLIAVTRTTPGPSRTEPAPMQRDSASLRQAARSPMKPPPLHAASAPSPTTTTKPARHFRNLDAMCGQCGAVY